MNHALVLNILIVLVVGLTLLFLQNPLALLGLLLLREMPYGLLAPQAPEEQTAAIGFID